MHRKTLLATLSVLLLILLLPVAGAAYLLDFSLRPANRGKDIAGSWAYMEKEYPYVAAWRDSLLRAGALRDTFILSADGTRLHAHYVRAPRPTRRTAVIVHGYTDNAVRMMMIGRMYQRDLRCNILLPDLRYSGLSGGDAIQMGWLDRLDVARWIETVPALFGDSARVVCHGISMGAATVMMLSGERQPPCVAAFVEDCGYTSVRDQFTKELKERFRLPACPLMDIASTLCRWRYGWDFDEASALHAVSRCQLPMLFIHGDADDFVPTYMVRQLYAAKPGRKELWIVPDAAHAFSYRDRPGEYTRRVAAFLQGCSF